MEQATQLTTPTASSGTRAQDPDRAAYKRAVTLADSIVGQLATLPRSAAVTGDLQGFSVRLNFGINDSTGVRQFADFAGIEVISSKSGDGLWLEARTRIEGVPVCAEVLMSSEAAAAFEQQAETPLPPAQDPQPAPAPMPLGESVTAIVPVIPSTPAAGQ